jgi:polysaccharide pyruvyl transferase WcaK-like protein
MKIGILTFHDGINHGAYLQCYGLYKTIENLGHDVKVVNYKNFKHWYREYKCFLWTKNPVLLFANIKKILKFKKSQKKLPKTIFTFSHKKVEKEKFDVIIIGSDRVWDYKNSFFGLDPIYFGSFLNSKKLFAYACSFGCVKPNDHVPRGVIFGLKKFSKISVRDENSLKILKRITYKPVRLVLDPIFLYPYLEEEKICKYNNFILIYSYQMSLDQIKQIKIFASKKNLNIIAIAYSQPWCDKNIIAISPFEWLGYFRNANYIITSTFHGTIFSIKYEKQFITLPNISINNKIEYILKISGLKNRILQNQSDTEKLLDSPINYKIINRKISKHIMESKKYLEESINE